MNFYKGREIDYTKEVEVYRCLNRKGNIYSVRQNGKVVAHTESIHLNNCKMVVNKGGKKRAIESMQRNVHAYVRGMIDNTFNPSVFVKQIRYNPFDSIGFRTNDNREIIESKTFFIINGLCFITEEQ